MYRILFVVFFTLALSGCWISGITISLSPPKIGFTQMNTEADLGKTHTKPLSDNINDINQEINFYNYTYTHNAC